MSVNPQVEGKRYPPTAPYVVSRAKIAEFAAAVAAILDGAHPGMGAAARRAVEQRYSWTASLARLDSLLARVAAPA